MVFRFLLCRNWCWCGFQSIQEARFSANHCRLFVDFCPFRLRLRFCRLCTWSKIERELCCIFLIPFISTQNLFLQPCYNIITTHAALRHFRSRLPKSYGSFSTKNGPESDAFLHPQWAKNASRILGESPSLTPPAFYNILSSVEASVTVFAQVLPLSQDQRDF